MQLGVELRRSARPGVKDVSDRRPSSPPRKRPSSRPWRHLLSPPPTGGRRLFSSVHGAIKEARPSAEQRQRPDVEAEHTAGAEAEQPRQRWICRPKAERPQPAPPSSSPLRSGGLRLLLLHRRPTSSVPKPVRRRGGKRGRACSGSRSGRTRACPGVARAGEEASVSVRGLCRRGGLLARVISIWIRRGGTRLRESALGNRRVIIGAAGSFLPDLGICVQSSEGVLSPYPV